MAIAQSQLETWSGQGSTALSSAAYTSIRTALEASPSPLAGRGVEIYLQGSYANSTHIRADSDVDVVVFYANTFFSDKSALSLPQQQLHERLFSTAPYQWTNLRDDVVTTLNTYFGRNAVRVGTKAIKVQTGSGRMTADVIPAVQYRRYATLIDANNQIVNYPKYHIERGEGKNADARTRGQYKPTIRVFKNFRNAMIDRGLLATGIAPSYYVECALHNVPDNHFIGRYADTVPAIITYLLNVPFVNLLCQNGVVPLIGGGPTQWSQQNFTAFIRAANQAWQNW